MQSIPQCSQLRAGRGEDQADAGTWYATDTTNDVI